MANCYVKAYFDWIEQTAALSDAEKGRLFISVLEYARSGLLPDGNGRESILFPAFKAAIDRDKEISAIRAGAGSEGGKQKVANSSKSKQKVANSSKTPTKTEDIRQKTEDIKQNTKTEYSASAALNDAILSFAEFRKKIKKPMTDRAIDLMIKKLNEFSSNEDEQIAILNQSILNGWTGIYELKKGGDGHGNTSGLSTGVGSTGAGSNSKWHINYSG